MLRLSKAFDLVCKAWCSPAIAYTRIKNLFYSPIIRIRLISQGRLWGGKVNIGNKTKFEHNVYFQGKGCLWIGNKTMFGSVIAGSLKAPIMLQPRDANAEITIGDRTAIMNGCELIARTSIKIGDDCLIGANIRIIDSDFHGVAPDQRQQLGKTKSVIIGDNVWTGDDVKILKGVIIGRDSVIGAGSVVTKSLPDGSICAGNPARIVGSAYEM